VCARVCLHIVQVNVLTCRCVANRVAERRVDSTGVCSVLLWCACVLCNVCWYPVHQALSHAKSLVARFIADADLVGMLLCDVQSCGVA
jgi:hypothetical protein